MQKFLSAALASAVLVTGTIGVTTVSAHADQYWRHGGGHHGGYYHGGGYGGRWDRGGRRHHDNGAALAAGIGGLALGAIIGGALSQPSYDAPPAYYYRPVPVERVYPARRAYRPVARPAYYGDHVSVCLARYKSYDPRSDTFLGYDGYRHRCNL